MSEFLGQMMGQISQVLGLVQGAAGGGLTGVLAQLENGGLALADGRYLIDYGKARTALAALAKELLEMEATGDRGRAEAWMKKYDVMPAALKAALAGTSDIPVDVYPVFSFGDRVQ